VLNQKALSAAKAVLLILIILILVAAALFQGGLFQQMLAPLHPQYTGNSSSVMPTTFTNSKTLSSNTVSSTLPLILPTEVIPRTPANFTPQNNPKGYLLPSSGKSAAVTTSGAGSDGYCFAPIAPCGQQTNHGGVVMYHPAIVLDFWAPIDNVNCSTQYFDTKTNDCVYGSTIYNYISDFCNFPSGSPLLNVINQYTDSLGSGLGTCSVYGGKWYYSTNAYPTSPFFSCHPSLCDGDIQMQAAGVLNTLGLWETSTVIDTIVFVFTPIGVRSCNSNSNSNCFPYEKQFCAYHSWVSGHSEFVYANMPDAAWASSLAGAINCGNLGGKSPDGDPWADLEVNTFSHEADESFTDPTLNTWYYNDGSHEIGDECSYDFVGVNPDGSNVNMGGHLYLIQSEWSNFNGGCTLDVAGSPAQVTISLYADSKFGHQNPPPANAFSVSFQEAGERSMASVTNCGVSCTVYVTPGYFVMICHPGGLCTINPMAPNVEIVPANSGFKEEWCFDQSCDNLYYIAENAKQTLRYYFYDLLAQDTAYSTNDGSFASPAPAIHYITAPSSPSSSDSPVFKSSSLSYGCNGCTNSTVLRFYVLRGLNSTVNVDSSIGGSISPFPNYGGSRWLTPPSQPTSWSPISAADQISNPVVYYHQWAMLVSYSIIGGGSPTAPTFSSTQLGAAFSTTLTTKPTNYWLDSGAYYSVTNPLGGSSSTEQWVSCCNTVPYGYIPGGYEIQAFSYQHQYLLTMQANPPEAAGIMSPAKGLSWLAAGKKLQLSAVPAFGFVFTGWTGSGPGSCSGPCSTAFTLNGPITETANFQEVPPTIPLAILGPITPPSPPSGGATGSSTVSLEVEVRYCFGSGPANCQPQPGVTVSVFVDGVVQCKGKSNPYYTCTYKATQGTHSWYATASRTGFFSATSPTWTFTYSPLAVTHAVTANVQFGSSLSSICNRGLNPSPTVNVTLYSGSTAIAINTLTLTCSVPSGSVTFSMLNAGTYTVSITGNNVLIATQSKTTTIPPNANLSFTI